MIAPPAARAIVLTLSLFVSFLCTLVAPDLARASSDQRHGLWIEGAQEGAPKMSAPVLATRYRFEVTGAIARARVDQHFFNPTDQWVEAVYRFPLPEKAAIDRLVLRIDDRVVLGVIDKREQARRTYEKARAQGKAAALVEAERENVFTISVANIPPRAAVSVELGFDQPVERAGLDNTLRLPLVVAPRYTHPIDMDAFFAHPDPHAMLRDLIDREKISVPLRPQTTGTANPVHLSFALKPGFTPSEIKSDTHAVSVKTHDEYFEAEIVNAVPADRDFELSWKAPADDAPHASLFVERDTDQPHAYVEILPPAEALWQPDETPQPRELILIIDQSGSMSGAPIRQARAALLFALEHVKAHDRINIISFDDHMRTLYSAPRQATADVLADARAFVRAVKSKGGTEMWPPLKLALRGEAPDGFVRQVVIATDALIGYESELLNKVEAARGSARIFPIAIGAAPNAALIRWAADVGQGTAIFINDQSQIEERMTEFLARITQPALSDIEVRFVGATATTAPAKPGDLFIGLPVTVSAKLDGEPEAVIIAGTMKGQRWEQRFSLSQAVDAEPDGPVARLYGRRKLAEHTRAMVAHHNDAGAREAIEEAATQIALDYGLLSRFTSLVAVDAEVIRPQGEGYDRQMVPVNPPKGASLFGGQARFKPKLDQIRVSAQKQTVSFAVPNTATPAQLALIIGIILMLAGLVLFYIYLKRSAPHARA